MSTPETSSNENCPQFNSIEWNELITSDPAGAMTFYGELFGWTSEKFLGGPVEYSIWKAGDRMFGGVMALSQPGVPPHWLNYVSVEDVEAKLAQAVSLGATVCLPVMDIGAAGRIAIVQDPQGAAIGLHQPPAMK